MHVTDSADPADTVCGQHDSSDDGLPVRRSNVRVLTRRQYNPSFVPEPVAAPATEEPDEAADDDGAGHDQLTAATSTASAAAEAAGSGAVTTSLSTNDASMTQAEQRQDMLRRLRMAREAKRAGKRFLSEDHILERVAAYSDKMAKAATQHYALKPKQAADLKRLQMEYLRTGGDMGAVLSHYSIPDAFKVAILENQQKLKEGKTDMENAIKDATQMLAKTAINIAKEQRGT